MKAERLRQVTTQAEETARNAVGVALGAEADVTTRLRTKAELAQPSGLMDAVVERGNLMLAYQRVVENKGAAGVDGIGVAEFKAHLKQRWPTIKAKLLAGTYIPQPVRRVDIPKTQGGVRNARHYTINRLNAILRGWAAYFKLTETKRALEELDGWLRRKLRCILW